MKRKGGGKPKGSAYERDICRRLSLWYTQGRRDDVFWRSAVSGGRATVGKAKGADLAHVAGDICAVHPDGYRFTDRWFVECKHYRDLQLHRFLIGEGKLWRFWEKARDQARAHGKHPMLIAKAHGFPELLLVEQRGILETGMGELFQYATIKEEVAVGLLSELLGEARATRRAADKRPPSHDRADGHVPVGPVPVARRAGKAKARPKIVRTR